MLRRIHDLQNLAVQATDGPIGEVSDFYFDDERWVVRYLIVGTGGWLSSRKVLISPIAIGRPDWSASVLPVSITREQVKYSPDIDTDKPVSRQQETQHLGHYGYPNYWGGPGFWGAGPYPGAILPGIVPGTGLNPTSAEYLATQADRLRAEAERGHEHDDPHLRSCNAVIGYHIHASDGDIGHVQGMLVEDSTWAIRYIVVETSNWWFGHRVLIAPQWIRAVSWPEQLVTIDLNRLALQDAPPYDSSVPLDRDQELRIFKHYGRASYWESEATPSTAESRR